jgi:cellulose synthase/poly-beta-1,6-N-acetylglucosamine synthase-like glycosyltransferase
MPKVLCSLPTRGRYLTTLPLVIQAIANQTRKVDKLVIFDDNDEPQDVRKEFLYQHLFWMLNEKGIEWEWLFAEKRGQHHIHQRANLMGYEWVWRCDDDAIPEPNVLENLLKHVADDVGGVGGTVFNPPTVTGSESSTGKIENVLTEPNIQWSAIKEVRQVEHLYSTFIYRAGVNDFNTGLSRVAHREETLFTWGLHKKGYKLLVVPNAVTWHLKNPGGGIRSDGRQEMYEHDERIFRNHLEHADKTIVVLNSGMGDHIVFSHVLPEIKNPLVFGCYPEIVPCRPIAEAQDLFGNLDCYNIYGKMDQWKWTGSLESAYRKMYL